MKDIKSCKLCHVQIKNLSVTKSKLEILKDISININCGELTAVIGKNGAGKTTFLKAILNEIKHSGSVLYIDEQGNKISSPSIGYIPQNLDFDKSSPISVEDFFAICHSNMPVFLKVLNKTRQYIIKILEKVNAAHLIDQKIGNLSGGELQRVLLAFATNPIPELLLLDEPVSGVDSGGLDIFYNLVSKLKEKHHIAMLIISHDLDFVYKYSDRVLLLDKSIVLDNIPDIVFNHKKFKQIF